MKTNFINLLLCVFFVGYANANPRLINLFKTANATNFIRNFSSSKKAWDKEQEKFIERMEELRKANKDSTYWVELMPNLESHKVFLSFSKEDQRYIQEQYNVVVKHFYSSLKSKQ